MKKKKKEKDSLVKACAMARIRSESYFFIGIVGNFVRFLIGCRVFLIQSI